MTLSSDKPAAVVILPAVGGGRLQDASLMRWLARANLGQRARPAEWLGRLLEVLDQPDPDAGQGAMRMWGQTGERPSVWVAAADPVYLEPRLDHLCVHAMGMADLPKSDFAALFDHLQATLGGESGYGFARIGRYGYLRAAEPIATAAVPPYVAHLDRPDEYWPAGPGADSHRRLVSEVEMALHQHPVNLRREDEGRQPVNALWLWGGGHAPEVAAGDLPPLFADDPLVAGYWTSRSGVVAAWPGDVASCAAESDAGFVAIVPDAGTVAPAERLLGELRSLLRSGRVGRLTLLFRDDIDAEIRAGHRWRVWRRRSAVLEAPG